jgi:hypothetical protein
MKRPTITRQFLTIFELSQLVGQHPQTIRKQTRR